MSEKRQDLQGVRGLAILAVLGFHFYPEFVPNGYLGVDQFFVLSGFLMCMLLTKSKNAPVLEIISNFYNRRLKRILPLYFLLILTSLLFLHVAFPAHTMENNRKSAKRALLLISNQLKTDEETYFEMLKIGGDIFTHTWSLSLEIQFYLLAPLIFLMSPELEFRKIGRKLGFLIVLVTSLVYFFAIPGDVAFVSVFARIWQFMIGMLAFSFCHVDDSNEPKYLPIIQNDAEEKEQKIEEEEVGYSILEPVLIFMILLGVFWPHELPAIYLRPIITFLTGFLFTISASSKLLSRRVLTYFGDISYSLYLIHWPIFINWKLTQNGAQLQLFAFLCLSIFLAVLTHETFEKWYTRSSSNSLIFSMIFVFFAASFAVLFYLEKSQKSINLDEISTKNWSLNEVEDINMNFIVNEAQNSRQNECRFGRTKRICYKTGLQNNGSKIMVIGNSWAQNHGKMIYETCGGRAQEILQINEYGCEPLYPSRNLSRCYQNVSEIQNLLNEFKPDYVFHLTRYLSYGDPIYPNDQIYQKILAKTREFLENIGKRMYLLNAIPPIHPEEIEKIVEKMRGKKKFVEIDQELVDLDNGRWENARKRYAKLKEDCGEKCEIIDYFGKFYNLNSKTWRFFDNHGVTYILPTNHLSPYGLKYVSDIFRDICDTM